MKINSKSITYFEADADCNIRICINGRWDSIGRRLEIIACHDPKTLIHRSTGKIRSLWWFMYGLIRIYYFRALSSNPIGCGFMSLNGSCLLSCILCICSCPWIHTNALAIATAVGEEYSLVGSQCSAGGSRAVPTEPECLRSLCQKIKNFIKDLKATVIREAVGNRLKGKEQPPDWIAHQLKLATVKPELFPFT